MKEVIEQLPKKLQRKSDADAPLALLLETKLDLSQERNKNGYIKLTIEQATTYFPGNVPKQNNTICAPPFSPTTEVGPRAHKLRWAAAFGQSKQKEILECWIRSTTEGSG